MTWKNLLKQIGMFLLTQGATLAFSYADKNKDGSLSKKEIAGVVKQVQELAKKYNNK